MTSWWLAFPSFLSVLSYAFLLIVALRSGVRNGVRGFFALFLMTMATWSFGSLMMRLNPERIVFWNGVMLAGGAGLMPVVLSAFVQAFLGKVNRLLLVLGALSSATVLAATATGHMIEYVRLAPSGQIEFSLGPALPFYGTYWLFFVGFSFYGLITSYRVTSDPVERNRIRYPLAALSFVLVGATTNAVPFLGAFPLDHLANLFAASLLTYAIVRYRLLDMRLVIRKGLLYSVPTIIIGTVYFLAISAAQQLLGAPDGVQLFVVSLGVAVLTALLLNPLRDRAQQGVDRVFFRQRYDAHQMLQRVSGAAASILNIQELTNMLADQVMNTMQVESAVFFVRDHDSQSLYPLSVRGLDDRAQGPLRQDHPLVEWFERHDRAITAEDMDLIPQFKALWGSELQQLDALGAVMYLPMRAKDELVGIFAVGPKRSGQPYATDERTLLATLANQVTMAVANALLYDEAQQEIADRKRAEEALRALSSRYSAILGAVPDIIMEIDTGCRFVWSNQAGIDFFGNHIVGERATFLWEATPERCSDAEPLQTLETEFYIENWQSREDGEERLLAWWCRKMSDSDGETTGVLCTARDITEPRRLEERLRQSSKMEAIGQLAGGVAHDFNNLLTVINGYSDFVIEALGPDSPLQSDMREIREAGARAVSFTRQLLAFSRRQVIEAHILDLNVVLQGMARMLGRLIGEDVELIFDLDPDLGPVRIDPSQIEQVVMNLAANARDAMPTGGTLTIRTSNEFLSEHPAITSGTVSGPHVMLSIADTGCGMPPEVQEHLFEPFFTTKEVGRGTGLGLATVYGIVTQSNGTIDVESTVGEGTTLRLYLPVPEHSDNGEDFSETRQLLQAGMETILVVEDEESVRRMTMRMLRRLGYRVLEAKHGAEAVAVYREHQYAIDLILTDVVMPIMSGGELVRYLGLHDNGTPVLYMSGYTDDVISHHGVLEPGAHLLQKPFSLEQLAERVRGMLDRDI